MTVSSTADSPFDAQGYEAVPDDGIGECVGARTKTNCRGALAGMVLCILLRSWVYGQEVRLLDRTVQVHGFGSQGFLATGGNNWLSVKSVGGSFAWSEFGVNVSTQVTSRFHVGAQLYDRSVGELGKWRPELDWAYGDYRVGEWLGVRGGKVKTVLGLHSNTQDLNFVHPWAILPQSIYPLDLRASTISHTGGDVYGRKRVGEKLGTVAYTAYAGSRSQDPHGGYVLGLASIGLWMSSYGGWMHGEDVRWETPLKGLTVGASLLNQHITGRGVYQAATAINPFLSFLQLPDGALEREHSIKDDYTQFYGQYTHGRLQVESEYRREYRLESVEYRSPADTTLAGAFVVPLDQRSGYGSVAFQVAKRLQVGTYFSWYFTDYSQDLSLPGNHVYDGDVTARYDVTPHWDVKVEGHFIDGYGRFDSIRGFYQQVNLAGFVDRTNGLVVKSGYNF